MNFNKYINYHLHEKYIMYMGELENIKKDPQYYEDKKIELELKKHSIIKEIKEEMFHKMSDYIGVTFKNCIKLFNLTILQLNAYSILLSLDFSIEKNRYENLTYKNYIEDISDKYTLSIKEMEAIFYLMKSKYEEYLIYEEESETPPF